MNNLLLLRALWEDLILLFFFGLLMLSGLEALLPEIVLSRLPLALLFFTFFSLFFGYLSFYKELPFPAITTIPLWFRILLGITSFLILLVSLRGFGLIGALIQIFLLIAFWLLLTKK